MIAFNGPGNGTHLPPPDDNNPTSFTSFPKNYRRMVPGEVTIKGDLCRDCSQPTGPWVAAEVGHTVRAVGVTFATPRSRQIDIAVVRRAAARFALWAIDHSYMLENMVTGQLQAQYCHCCGVRGEPDLQALDMNVEQLFHDGAITQEEYDEIDAACESDEDYDFVDIYDAINGRRGPDKRLPPVPMEYDHAGDCFAFQTMCLMRDFGEVFGEFAGQNLHLVADLKEDEREWL